MDTIIPTKEQLLDMKTPSRQDWSKLYADLEEHGALIVPGDGAAKRMAYDHFKKMGKRVRWKLNRSTGMYGIWIEGHPKVEID